MYLDGNISGKSEPSEAARWFLIAARGGDIEAAFKVGCLYEVGSGINRDPVEAAKWYRKAAEHGWKPAQYKLGTLYENGIGVSEDLQEAAKWYGYAADQSGDAAYHSARLLASQHVSSKIREDAPELFRRAAGMFQADAELGDPTAAEKLAKMYEGGTGVAQSYLDAFFWYSLAQELGANAGPDITRAKSHLTTSSN